jgi:8-amino-7-oxononanoate synthase
MHRIEKELEQLAAEGNLRHIPAGAPDAVDFSLNDYLGLGGNARLREDFFAQPHIMDIALTSCASRLLAADQNEYTLLENALEKLYGRPCLLFNSGYHANTGLISAFADKETLIVADKLVHASIIDGYKLSDATMQRFRHNDVGHLEKILAAKASEFKRVIIVVESVYSMDGDVADLHAIVELKRRYPDAMLYVDEAHAFGAMGRTGLGLAADCCLFDDVDILVGTFGKAAASQGAFAILDSRLKEYAVNRSRSFIFSTALPPLNCAWTRFVINHITRMEPEREHLRHMSRLFHDRIVAGGKITLPECTPTHICPIIIGGAAKVVEMSARLLELGFKVLPIRTPTVPPGTERLRVSLSAAMSDSDVEQLADAINSLL